jgi:YHS domain-containing protein
MNQPVINQPVMNQPAINQPVMNQPVMNQPAVNQPLATQPPPAGQPPFGPAVGATAPFGAVPSGISPPYGGAPRAIASPPTLPEQSPPPMVAQRPLGPPQNTVAPLAPAGGPAFALDGFCPVTLAEKQQWVPGDNRWGMYHRGRLYRFAGPEEQRRFHADPDRYAPAVSGNDIVLATEQGQVVPGMREHGVFYGNHVYLFSSEASLEKFSRNPGVYANQALQALRTGGAYRQGQQWR